MCCLQTILTEKGWLFAVIHCKLPCVTVFGRSRSCCALLGVALLGKIGSVIGTGCRLNDVEAMHVMFLFENPEGNSLEVFATHVLIDEKGSPRV